MEWRPSPGKDNYKVTKENNYNFQGLLRDLAKEIRLLKVYTQ